MGVDYHTYLGPFIKIKNEKVNKEISIESCPKKSCVNHGKELREEFCSKCGSKKSMVTTTVKENNVDFYEFNDGFNESLSQVTTTSEDTFKGYSYLIPNLQKANGRKLHIDTGDFSITTNFNKEEEIEWMEKKYIKEIKALEKLVGSDKVDIGWGIITYNS